jgi:hypothetical protein
VDALNTLRAVLVACAFVAALLLAFDGMVLPALVMFVGIAAHLALFWYLHAQKQRDADRIADLHGIPAAER